MGKYLKLFNEHTEYVAFTQTEDFVLPNVSHCITENHVHYNPIVPHDYTKDYLTFVAIEDGTFQFNKDGISYSLDDGETWTNLTKNTNTPTITTGNKILWKGVLTPMMFSGVGTFSSTGQYNVQGNIMSLIYGDDYAEETGMEEFCYYGLFNYDTNVVNAVNLSLPALTLTNSCYYGMFQGCTSLTTAPVLPATTLASNCYSDMFSGCTSLVNAPELPATTLANVCYQRMFEGCTSLTTAPELPAQTLAVQCYSIMFSGCTGLITAPVLPATTLVSDCYSYMFQDCTSLNYIKAMFTTEPGTNYTTDWVSGVAASGTFVKNTTATWNVTGVNGIPTGWTIQTASA